MKAIDSNIPDNQFFRWIMERTFQMTQFSTVEYLIRTIVTDVNHWFNPIVNQSIS